MLETLRETLGTPITLRHCQITAGKNAGNAKGNTGNTRETLGTLRGALGTLRETLGTLRETLGTLSGALGTQRETLGTLRKTLGTPITLCHCQVMPGTLHKPITPGTLKLSAERYKQKTKQNKKNARTSWAARAPIEKLSKNIITYG